MHATPAVNPIPFANLFDALLEQRNPVDRLSENSYQMDTIPYTPDFSLPPQISLCLSADRTLPYFRVRNRTMHGRFSPLDDATTVPYCDTNACTLNPFVGFYFPTLEGASRPTFLNHI